MNNIKKCSISGVAFSLDEEAYKTLEAYLESLRESYGETADGREIVADIEARIAELILSTQEGDRVVQKPLIDNIIAQMGSARDISRRAPRRVSQGQPSARSPASRAASTATRPTPSWAAYAPASANTSTSTPYGYGSACSCR